ncbi:MAG: coenzyme F420-0:L-glutamate ligase, partial [Thermodesulfobacteriota bacterium]
IKPSKFALKLADEISKDPKLMEVILWETKKIIKMDERVNGKGRLIVETDRGLISANAGVDASNVSGGDKVTLLPLDSDKSAKLIRNEIKKVTKKNIAVIISDTVGRPWRNGLVDIAIGCAGINPLRDLRGQVDSKGLLLVATEMATADQIACAAGLLMEKTEGIPVVIVRGCNYLSGDKGSAALIRDAKEDLFR